MSMLKSLPAICLLGLILTGCETGMTNMFKASDKNISLMGRTDQLADGDLVLISSGATAWCRVSGESCKVLLETEVPEDEHGFAVMELDGRYLGRFRVSGDSVNGISIPLPSDKRFYNLKVIKATEPHTGNLILKGISCESIREPDSLPVKAIEFIGNSITCGMGADVEEIPCGTGLWYDQHNAYWSYGAIIARRLNARFVLSSVSGMGLYRNWNNDGPAMTEVYRTLYLNGNSNRSWNDPSWKPDVISISLGTNDLSEGDGVHYRKPFDRNLFISKYIAFIEDLYRDNPDVKVALLSSPVVTGSNKRILKDCLNDIQQHFSQLSDPKIISLFLFDRVFNSGCTGHPDKNDHQEMADMLEPFFSSLLDE